MFPPGWLSDDSALAVVPSAVLSTIWTETDCSDGCAGVCQVCRTNHMFSRGGLRTEKGIGHLLVKSIEKSLLVDRRLHLFTKDTNIFFANAKAKYVSPYFP